MPAIDRTETNVWVSDLKTNKFDILPSLEVQTDVVDSMSPPHAAEYVTAQRALAQDCATLQLIDKDIEEWQLHIARAHAQIRLLERQRNAVQHRVSIHRARLSPARTIPDQVLQEIFQHCLPETPYVVPSARSAPLILTHVCRRWRAVAQGTSELWSSIALNDRGVWNYELELEMVKRWLRRSHMWPISMSITCTPWTNFGVNGNATCSDIFQLAVAHSSHLRDLCLNVSRSYLQHFLYTAHLPVLRSIDISVHRVNESQEPAVPTFISAPHLRRVALKGSAASTSLVPRLLLPQITHLSLDSSLALDLDHLFQDFCHLEHLTLMLSLSWDSLRFQLPPAGERRVSVSLLSLEVRLDREMLTFGDPSGLETLLDCLDLPALQTLSVSAPPGSCYHERTGHTEDVTWESHGRWVHMPSVGALLSRSRYTQPELRCYWQTGVRVGGI